jgi:hypothetical protein
MLRHYAITLFVICADITITLMPASRFDAACLLPLCYAITSALSAIDAATLTTPRHYATPFSRFRQRHYAAMRAHAARRAPFCATMLITSADAPRFSLMLSLPAILPI